MSTYALAPAAEPHVVRGPSAAALWTVAVLGVVAGASSLAFALTNDAIGKELGEPFVIASLWTWTTLAYIFCGMLAWWRRPGSRLGPLMIATGFACYLSALTWTTSDLPYTIGQALDKLPPVLFLWVFLAFPTGRLATRFERLLVGTAALIGIGLELARMVLGDYGPHNLIGLAPSADVFEVVRRVQLLGLSACCLAGVALLLARRWRLGRPVLRPSGLLLDAFALGLTLIAVLFIFNAFGWPGTVEVRRATFVALGIAPLVFLVGVLDARLARSAVADLFVRLRADPDPAELRDALADALRDPSLTLVYWLPEFASFADIDGQEVELPDSSVHRSTIVIERNGERVAALIHDPALDDEPELLRAVTAAAGIAIENARLHVDLRARLEELAGSRARVIQAEQRERRRLERDLHDGAQQRLIALSLEVKRLEMELGDNPEARRRLDEFQREITISLDELRAVAHGLHPAVLTDHGLAVALEQVAALAPVPIRLSIDVEERLPEQVEVAAYFVVTESLANIGKHAQATQASVEVARTSTGLLVEIVDDGIGGADTEKGSGLRGLADRVEALRGRLRVWSPVGRGTRVRAEIPCA